MKKAHLLITFFLFFTTACITIGSTKKDSKPGEAYSPKIKERVFKNNTREEVFQSYVKALEESSYTVESKVDFNSIVAHTKKKDRLSDVDSVFVSGSNKKIAQGYKVQVTVASLEEAKHTVLLDIQNVDYFSMGGEELSPFLEAAEYLNLHSKAQKNLKIQTE
jgi:hypothetical protein